MSLSDNKSLTMSVIINNILSPIIYKLNSQFSNLCNINLLLRQSPVFDLRLQLLCNYSSAYLLKLIANIHVRISATLHSSFSKKCFFSTKLNADNLIEHIPKRKHNIKCQTSTDVINDCCCNHSVYLLY